MKRFMLFVAGLVFAAGVAMAEESKVEAAADQKTVTLKVEGMTCDHCSSAIDKKLAATKGVVSCKADHKAGSATVAFKPAEATEADLVAAINKLGFKASPPAADKK